MTTYGREIVFSCRDSACFSVMTISRQRFSVITSCTLRVTTCLVLAGISLSRQSTFVS